MLLLMNKTCHAFCCCLRYFLVLAIALLPSLCLAGPSKNETVKFILNKLNNESHFSGNHQPSTKWIFREKDCSLHLPRFKSQELNISEATIPLLQTNEPAIQYIYEEYNLDLHCSNEKLCIYDEFLGSNSNNKVVKFGWSFGKSQAAAEKLSKAISHLKALCDGKSGELF